MTVFMFIGQGNPPPWVAPDVLEAEPVAALATLASELVGIDVMKLLVRGGRDLDRCEVLQPAMIAVCTGIVRLLDDAGVRPSIVVGHSLGEISAWMASGAITAEDAVRVAALRGRLMAREAASHPGGMVRLKGNHEACDRALDVGARAGKAWLGAHNAPDEYAISGDEAALAAIIPAFPVVRLPVVGAWHCPAMAGAHEELAAALTALPRRAPRARLVTNRDGTFAAPDDIPALLAGQLVHPVEWAACLDTIAAAGATRFLALGPGKSLRALVYRNLGTETNVDIVDSLDSIADAARVAA